MFNKQIIARIKQGLTYFLVGTLGIAAIVMLCPLWMPAVVGYMIVAEYKDFTSKK